MDSDKTRVHLVRLASYRALKRLKVSRKEMLDGLADCRRLIERKALAERVISAAGYEAGRFLWNERFELYCDISDDDGGVGYISKEWEDPSYRLATSLTIPREFAGSLSLRAKEVFRTCVAEGLFVTPMADADGLTVTLECVICEASLNRESFRNWFRRLARCGILVQDSMDASVVDALTA